MRGDKLEMLDHRMRPGHAELAGHLHALVARVDRGELDAGVHHMLFGAVEAPEEIEMPPGAAEFAVGDRLQADLFLLLDDALDLAVLDLLQLRGRDLALGLLRARLMDRLRTQQAADMIGAEGWSRVFAHCSSALSVLPLVPAKAGTQRGLAR